MITKLRFSFIVLFIMTVAKGFAQAPAISYSSPKTYPEHSPIAALSPTNTGGAVVPAVTLTSYLDNPRGIAVDASGNIYVADNLSNRVLKLPAGGGPLVAVGSGFIAPRGVAVDASGNIYVTDNNGGTLKEILAVGGATIVAASGFNSLYGVAIDASGNIYVSDFGAGVVKEIPSGGGTAVTLATGFNGPCGLAVDAGGNVYVADRGNNLVKKITVGTGTTVNLGSGFNSPIDVSLDASGNIYVADLDDDEVKQIPAGGGLPILIYTNSGFVAGGIVLDSSGHIFASSDGAYGIVQIAYPQFYTISPALPAGLSFNNYNGVISGSPTALSPATNYTVTAYNPAGSVTAVVNITVH